MCPRAEAAVAALVLLAGCGGAFFDGGGPTTTETLTPAPVGSVAEAGPPAARPPGVATDGSVDVAALRRAHRAAIGNRTYAWTFSYRANGTGDGYRDRWFTRRVAVGDSRYLATRSDPPSRVWRALYVDETGGYLRTLTDDATYFEFVREPGPPTEYANTGELIRRYLTGLPLTVDSVTRDGRTYYRVYSTGGGKPDVSEGFNAPRAVNYRVTAYVTPDGLVRTLAVEYDRSRIDGYHHVSVRFDYAGLDATTVDRPAWVDRVTTPSESPTRVLSTPPARGTNATAVPPAPSG